MKCLKMESQWTKQKKIEENNLLSLCENEKNPCLFLSETVIAYCHPTAFSYICSQMCFGGR